MHLIIGSTRDENYILGGAGNYIFASFLYDKCLLSLVSYHISNHFDSYYILHMSKYVLYRSVVPQWVTKWLPVGVLHSYIGHILTHFTTYSK